MSKGVVKCDILMQIPVGSIPLSKGFFTQGKYIELNPNETETLCYYFYFPMEQNFVHFPAQVSFIYLYLYIKKKY